MDNRKKKQTAIGLWVLAAILTLSSGLKLIVAIIAVINGERSQYSYGSIAFDTMLLIVAILCQRKGNSYWQEAKKDQVVKAEQTA